MSKSFFSLLIFRFLRMLSHPIMSLILILDLRDILINNFLSQVMCNKSILFKIKSSSSIQWWKNICGVSKINLQASLSRICLHLCSASFLSLATSLVHSIIRISSYSSRLDFFFSIFNFIICSSGLCQVSESENLQKNKNLYYT